MQVKAAIIDCNQYANFDAVENEQILQAARKTIATEAVAIGALGARLNSNFSAAVAQLAACAGRIVVSGIGKSALVAQKIVATLNSTGSPAVFLHAADAIHGDLGMVQKTDAVILISKSGESAEIKVLVPLIKNFGSCLIAITGNINGYLARNASYVLDTTVEQEACPYNLAPTTSSTAQMVMGDAIAVCLMEQRGFNSQDFARLHPGGALGKRLYLRVADLYKENPRPEVNTSQSVKEVILEITRNRLGVTAVTGADGKLAGIITDGDLRRMLEKSDSIERIEARDILTENPITITPDALAVAALYEMRKNEIMQLVVVENGNYLGIIHLHDLIKEGII